jgi:hypothetical protein
VALTGMAVRAHIVSARALKDAKAQHKTSKGALDTTAEGGAGAAGDGAAPAAGTDPSQAVKPMDKRASVSQESGCVMCCGRSCSIRPLTMR